MGFKPTYMTLDRWQAAYLDVYDVPYVGCPIRADGRPEWTFDNANDEAWQAGIEFRSGDNAVAPVLRLRNSYRFMGDQATNARRGKVSTDGYKAK